MICTVHKKNGRNKLETPQWFEHTLNNAARMDSNPDIGTGIPPERILEKICRKRRSSTTLVCVLYSLAMGIVKRKSNFH